MRKHSPEHHLQAITFPLGGKIQGSNPCSATRGYAPDYYLQAISSIGWTYHFG